METKYIASFIVNDNTKSDNDPKAFYKAIWDSNAITSGQNRLIGKLLFKDLLNKKQLELRSFIFDLLKGDVIQT